MNPAITPEMERRNGRIFLISYVLIFFAAPVLYIGIVQAALCNKLGASAMVSNLPAATYMLGSLCPLVLSWLVPPRLNRAVVVWSNVITAILIGGVFLTLAIPFSTEVRIAALVLQGLVQGFCASASQVFMISCLRSGTTPAGQAQALKTTFTITPLCAVAGSLGAQFILNSGIPSLKYPYDFALVHLIGVPCVALVAWFTSRFQLPEVRDEPRQPAKAFFGDSAKALFTDRTMLVLWFGYLLWYITLNASTNFSLYTREAMGRDPNELAGWIMAIRFGCKALGGFVLGLIALRFGLRASVITTVALLGVGCLWAWVVPGYGYLLSFGIIGMGELGGAYFPNYVAAISPLAISARNVAILTLAAPPSAIAPPLHGWLTDNYGFAASFAFGIFTAILCLALFRFDRKPESSGSTLS
ncbi:MAG: MFS transporter [Bryobacteraceae bacterium]